MKNDDNPWITLSTKLVYENPWIKVREDRVISPDGTSGVYGVVEICPSAGIVAIDNEDNIILVGQWRYVHNKFSWEIPTGGSDDSDRSTLETAKRELKEETGLTGAEWISIGSIDNSNGVTTDTAALFLTTRLTSSPRVIDSSEPLITKWVKLDQAVEMVMNGEITESCSVAAILKVNLILKRSR